ncbi:nuclear transport factor 2 family protein [Neiella marina]|uniref:Nuclear transport factor 2 family protein n=1 Tax=Neiella holothuriorum TaxID=2870530 RepID=A0ABS7EHV2_9GAMM|nr:nuclear transport factor 2 family protein [Neiella holothuriorum]MBW8191927.1 nuclear transport factor 2 family protein [Neiella holothuriorum]
MKWIEQFKAMYQNLNASNLASLDQFYAPQAVFIDPFHQVDGLAAIRSYFSNLYANVDSIGFDYNWQLVEANQAVIGWTMRYRHPRVNRGRTVQLEGVSRIEIAEQLIVRHQDYFDGGAMLYEHLPLLGSAVRYLKHRMVDSEVS